MYMNKSLKYLDYVIIKLYIIDSGYFKFKEIFVFYPTQKDSG